MNCWYEQLRIFLKSKINDINRSDFYGTDSKLFLYTNQYESDMNLRWMCE